MTAAAFVQKVKNLPPVSESALKLVNLLERSSVDNNDVVQVLKYDNVLTAKLLKACNAPSFGLEESVSSVDQAVFILGHEQILHTVMTLAFGSVMTGSPRAYIIEANEVWRHSLVSAMAVEIVLEEVPQLDVKPGVAFTASLLHDIGKLVFALTLSPEDLAEIRDRIERMQISGVQAEKEFLGADHGEVGAALLQSWRLPQSIVEGVANHHCPVLKSEPRISTLVHITNAIAHHSVPPPVQYPHDLRIADAVAAEFGLGPEKIEKMTVGVRESSERVEQFMAMA